MSESLVSVISPCYNGEKYIVHFLESILAQTYPKVELIFVDDGSTDHTRQIVQGYSEKFVQKGYKLMYIHQKNGGQASAINQGLRVFSGDYLMWVDADDILGSENILKKVRFLQEHPECGFVLCKAKIVKSSAMDQTIGIAGRERPEGYDNLFDDLLFERNVCFNPCIIMARASAIRASIPSCQIYESREGQNWQLMLPLSRMFSCGYINETLCTIVEHDDSHSRRIRTLTEKLERNKGIIDLQINVINSLDNIEQSEKERLINQVIIYQKKKMWCQAMLCGERIFARKIACELKNAGYQIGIRDYFSEYLKQKYGNTWVRKYYLVIKKILKR